MPFKSEKQRRYLWLKHPDVARRWTKEYGSDTIQRAAKKRVKSDRRTEKRRS